MSSYARPSAPLWEDRDDLISRLLAVCSEAIGIRTGMAIEGLRLLSGAESGHLVLGFDYVWSQSRQPLVAKLFRSHTSVWAPEELPITKLRREVALTHWLAREGWPVPMPLWSNADGVALDAPAILSVRLPGKPWPALWADASEAVAGSYKRLALQQARLHALPIEEWPGHGRIPLLGIGVVLGFLAALVEEVAHGPTTELFDQVQQASATIEELPPVLVHGDYRLDNMLFDQGEVSALLDWEGAVRADPRWDLADARASLAPHGDAYLAIYQTAARCQLPAMPFWDALHAVRTIVLRRWQAGRTEQEGQRATLLRGLDGHAAAAHEALRRL